MPSSQPQATPVDDAALRRACAEALEELRAARKFIASQDSELRVAAEVITLERRIADGHKRIGSLSADEITQLRVAIAAKDRVIAAYEAEISVLKKKNSFWSKFKWAAAAAAAGIVAGVVIANE